MALTDEKGIKQNLTDKNDLLDKVPAEEEKPQYESEKDVTDDSKVDGVIDLSATRKKKFHVNRGSGAEGTLELNTSDMGIVTRLEQLYPRLQKLSQDAAIKQLNKQETEDDGTLNRLSQALTKIDMEMRKLVDDIFDSNVSEVCAPSGSMIDPFNGEFRFEHIINEISKLYENNISDEFRKMSEKMKKRTNKYTKGK